MKLWIVKYWVPFPTSEYGGLQLVAAESREQLQEFMLRTAGKRLYEGERYHPNWRELVMAAVANAQEAVLPNEPEIVAEFLT